MDKRIRVSLSDVNSFSALEDCDPVYKFASMLLNAITSVVKLASASLDDNRYKYVYRNSRYINPRYYRKYKHLEFPRGYKWSLITLTVRRDIPLYEAWAEIGKWVSKFLHNLRAYFYRRKIKVHYFWVIEPHNDGYPHVHILIAFPFLPIEKLISWWSYSEPQGVDVRFIGSDYQALKNYVIKYLVKGHYVDFEVNYKEGYIEFGLIPFLLWHYKVRVIGRSRGFTFTHTKKGEWVYIGQVLLTDVLYDVRERLEAMGIPYDRYDLLSLLASFLTYSGLVFEYKTSKFDSLPPYDFVPEDFDF